MTFRPEMEKLYHAVSYLISVWVTFLSSFTCSHGTDMHCSAGHRWNYAIIQLLACCLRPFPTNR